MSELGDGTAVLHVGCVATSAEDTANLHLSICVSGSDQSTSCIVDQSSKLDRNALEGN